MNKYRIWISPPHLSGKEIDFVKDAFDKNWITTMGDNVTGFENDLQSFLGGNSEVVALNSGTSALHLALMLLGVQKGDWVLCQDFTFAATINPVIYLEAKPVLIDSERLTWNLSPEYLEEAIIDCSRKGKKPKAIVWVNLYGMPAQIDEIQAIAQKYDIVLLEDAAESLGSAYKGQKCGTFGNASVISFNGNKIITSSSGGVFVSSDKALICRARFLASQARDTADWYQHSQIGYNYGMSNIVAGVGRGQMTVLEDRIVARRSINRYYRDVFASIPGITVHTEPDERFFSNHWLSCILVDPKQTDGVDCAFLREKLAEEGIESRFLWKPMHRQPIFENGHFYGEHVSDELFRTGLCLPSGSNLSTDELEEISSIIIKNIKRC
ncbi:MAG: aminotransferase class I/II-fold pyridoxal phosphate-dependent enzyme [Candidatus Symbiothrix sp.]|jgi:dTDP-4-amino-4,6-dideoxygalactose transaminase|nr:aminotransferase class I/II-fold pyridoxal phosphate-dependent enzyme [Candidatus Symbiothrix sp.]